MREGYVNLAVSDDDLFNQSFNNLSFVHYGEQWPPFLQGVGLMHHVICGELVQLQEVDLSFKLGEFR